MLRVNLADGRTLSFDLADPEQLAAWRRHQATNSFQATIRGMSVLHDKRLTTLPVPRRFRAIAFSAEPLVEHEGVIGELVSCQADDVRVTCTVYFGGGKITRTDLVRTGRPRFRPEGCPWPPMKRNDGT